MTKRHKGVIAVIVCAALVLLTVILCLNAVRGGTAMNIKRIIGGSLIVGEQIAAEDITDFYYTYDASTNPPEYRRFRFYTDGGRYYFYHEKREGDHWPLTEADVTVSATRELTEQEWQSFLDLVNGGSVEKRREETASGSAGPWLFLYWNGDRGKYQVFSFSSYDKQFDFETYCTSLIKESTE